MDKKVFLEDMWRKGKISQNRYDKGIAKIIKQEADVEDYKVNKGKMNDSQKIARIEKILGL